MTTRLAPRNKRLVSLAVFAEHADVSQKTIRRRIADGTLPAYRVGRLIKLDLADLDRLAVRIPAVGSGSRVA